MRKGGGAQSSVRKPLFHLSTQYHMAVISKACEKGGGALELSAEPCFPPINTLSHGCHIKSVRKGAELRAHSGTLHSTCQHIITWWSHRKCVRKGAELKALIGTLYSPCQHIITWWSDQKLVTKEAGLRA